MDLGLGLSSLLRLRRRHLAALPRKESRLAAAKQHGTQAGKRQTRVGRNLQEEEESWEEGALKTGRKDLPRHEGERVCEVEQEIGGRGEAGSRGRRPAAGRGGRLPGRVGGAGAAAGVGSSQTTAQVRAAGALSTAPGASVGGGGA